MNFLKFFAQIISICLLIGLPTVSYAELKGNLYGDDVVTEDGESFNIGEFNNLLVNGNLDAAESVYTEWVKRRQKMLNNGAEFGILDLYIKHCHARILYKKKKYDECIFLEDEVLEYIFAHLKEEHEKIYDWRNQMYNSMLLKKFIYEDLKDHDNTLRIQKELVNFLETTLPSDNPNLLKEKMALSVCFYLTKDYKTATALDEELLPKVEKVFGANAPETRSAKLYLAEDYRKSLRYSEAVKLYEEILKSDIIVYGSTDEKTIQSYNKLISVNFQLGNWKEMGLLLDRVMPIAETNLKEDSKLKQALLENKVYYYTGIRQTQKATELGKRILAMTNNYEIQINLLIIMAENYRCVSDYSNALKHILKAWDIYEKYLSENKSKRATILEEMSIIYGDLGSTYEAIQFAQEALDLNIEIFGYYSRESFSSMDALARCYVDAKQYNDALKLWKENYEICINLFGNDINHKLYPMWQIAASYYALKDHELAIHWAKEMSDESVRLLGEKNPYTLMGWTLLAHFYELDDAIKILKMVLATELEFLSDNDPKIDNTIYDLACVYEKSNRRKEAIPLYEKVIERRENRADSYGSLTADEKMSIFSDQSSVYVDASNLYFKDNKFKDAFRVLERGKSRLLIDSYAEQIVKSSGILDNQEVLKLNEYKAGIANYANLIDEAFQFGDEQARFNLESEQRKLSDEYVKYKEFLQNKYPKYKTVSQANKIDFERDKKILPDDTAFVEFMVAGNEITAFIFDKNSDINAVKIDVPENFLSTCNYYRELSAEPSDYPDLEAMPKDAESLRRSYDEIGSLKKNLSKELGKILFAPLADYISKYPNLIISPDKDLNNIPFETLEFNGKFAIESFNISYVPSFAVLKLMQEAGEKNSKQTNRQELFAMGNAFYGNNDRDAVNKGLNNFFRGQRGKFDINELQELEWDNLPGSKKEVDEVSKIFGTKKIFSEKSASESNLKSSNRRNEISKYKYILFSTHGIFIPYAPEYSSIVLSQKVDTDEDGYVTIGEWMGLNLNSDVVFLSACESGLGDYQAGEGIVGIPYALTVAGNKDTVMSLWKVYDAYTPEFVSTFFKKLNEGKSAFIAINETKREFLKSSNSMYRDPAVWSAFVLYGF